MAEGLIDQRVEYVVESARSLCKVEVGGEEKVDAFATLRVSAAVDKFLNDTRAPLLRIILASFTDGEEKVLASLETDSGEVENASITKEISFLKTTNETITEENISRVVMVVASAGGSGRGTLDSLYHSISKLYAPRLAWNTRIDGKTMSLIQDLDTSLRGEVASGGIGITSPDEESWSLFQTPSEEMQEWVDQARRHNARQHKAGLTYSKIFTDIFPRFKQLKLGELGVSEVLDLLDDTRDSLDDAWQSNEVDASEGRYTVARMRNFLRLIAVSIATYVRNLVESGDKGNNNKDDKKDDSKDDDNSNTAHNNIGYPEPSELVSVYSAALETAVVPAGKDATAHSLEVSESKWRQRGNLQRLAETMVGFYHELKQHFSVDDQRHYLFTPRDLTAWVLGLLRYDTSTESLLDVFAHEAQRLFRDRIVSSDKEAKFDQLLFGALKRQWSYDPRHSKRDVGNEGSSESGEIMGQRVKKDNDSTVLPLPMSLPRPSTDREDYIEFARSLAETDSPEQFGLPLNVERAKQRESSTQTIAKLKGMTLASASTEGFDREKWRSSLSPVLDCWTDLLRQPGAKEVVDVHSLSSHRDPLTVFVRQQMSMGNKIVAWVDEQLRAIRRVVNGTGLLTPTIQKQATALIASSVPSKWEDRWEGPEDPLQWCKAVIKRKIAIRAWTERSRDGSSSLLSSPLDLSELFSPATFLDVLRQLTARRSGKSMDLLTLVAKWGKNVQIDGAEADCSARLKGLLLQGGVFAEGRRGGQACELVDCPADGIELVRAPQVTIAWVFDDDNDNDDDDGNQGEHSQHQRREKGSSLAYRAPLYLTNARTRLLTEIPTSVRYVTDIAKYTVAGVAFFLSGRSY